MVQVILSSCIQAFDELAAPATAAQAYLNGDNVSFPANVSGTYKGSWNLEQPTSGQSVLPLTEDQGSVALQLKALHSGTQEVLDVEVHA